MDINRFVFRYRIRSSSFFKIGRSCRREKTSSGWERGLCFSCSASLLTYFFFCTTNWSWQLYNLVRYIKDDAPDDVIILFALEAPLFYDLIHHHMEEFFMLCKHRILVDISTYREHARFRHRDPKKNIRNWAGTHVLCNHYPGRIRKALCLSSLLYNDDLL